MWSRACVSGQGAHNFKCASGQGVYRCGPGRVLVDRACTNSVQHRRLSPRPRRTTPSEVDCAPALVHARLMGRRICT
eukprot:351127-Chlamydomonas_euryale.AAC.4